MGPMTTSFGSLFIKNQFRTHIPNPPKGTSLKGKVAIVTGASGGLGAESSKQMLRLGLSHLIVAVRSVEKGKAAVTEMRKATQSQAKIEVWPLEMESYDSIRQFARRCEAELSRIDIVILNAGLFPGRSFNRSSTGHEKGIQVNYLSTMLLAVLLLPILDSKSVPGTPPRITVVNSVLATMSKLPEDKNKPLLPQLDSEDTYDGANRYNITKLLCQLFLVKLAELIDPNKVTINMVEPGFTKGTDLSRDFTGILGAFDSLFKSLAARPVEKGALCYMDAVAVKGTESHGCFLMNCEIAP